MNKTINDEFVILNRADMHVCSVFYVGRPGFGVDMKTVERAIPRSGNLFGGSSYAVPQRPESI